MGGEVGCVGERSWGLGWHVVRHRCRCRLCLSRRVMIYVMAATFFCVFPVQRL